MVTATLFVLVEPPSLIVYENTSPPVEQVAGSYVTRVPPLEIVADPLPGFVTDVIVTPASVSPAPPESFASGFSTVVTVALIDTASFFARTGSSLPGVTVIATVAAGEVSVPSVAVYVNASLPTKFAFGV